MTSEDAYQAICETILQSATKRLVNQSFDSQSFGNFVIEFMDLTEERLIVCDRSQVFFSENFEGTKNFRLVVPSLREVTKLELLEALELDRPSSG